MYAFCGGERNQLALLTFDFFFLVCFLFRWGQIFILDSLANYAPKDERDAQGICERVTPRLAHANAAVVLSAVKVCIKRILVLTLKGPGFFVYLKSGGGGRIPPPPPLGSRPRSDKKF